MKARQFTGLLAAAALLAGCSLSPHPAAAGRVTAHRTAGTPVPGLATALAGLGRADRSRPYYLSLGDSLAQGIQPGLTGSDRPTNQGYPDQLAAMLRSRIPGLRLVKLGCSGETTSTMIRGGTCRYPAGSQLAQAAEFLSKERGSVALVTIDIGANDPNSCVIGQPVSTIFSCLSTRVTQTERNISAIMSKLRSAAGPDVLIVGMTYYVPELGLWQSSSTGKEAAIMTEGFAAGVNQLLVKRYHHYGAKVADVFTAFKSMNFGHRSAVPPNVSAICRLTWMCAAKPRGPNEHANEAGYHLIARTFWHAITGG